MTWSATGGSTVVDVGFTSLAANLTRVEVVHSGWESLTDSDFANATTAVGGYSAGWRAILYAVAAHLTGNPGKEITS